MDVKEIMFNIYLGAVAFSFGSSLFAFSYRFPRRFRLFSIFLGLTLLVEMLLHKVFPPLKIKGYTNATYNAFALVEVLFYTYFFYQLGTKGWIKKIQRFFLICFPVIWALLVFDHDGFFAFHGSVIATGGFFIVCFALSYLYFLSESSETKPIQKIPEFWISIGLVVFYCCETPYMGAIGYLYGHYPLLANLLLYVSIAINTIMYCLFGYAFLCRKRNY